MGRISISTFEYFEEIGAAARFDSISYMLGQDVSNSIMPFRSARHDRGISILCEEKQRRGIEGQINLLFHTPYEHIANSSVDSIVDFVRKISHRLVHYRDLHFEIVEEQFDKQDLKRLRSAIDPSRKHFHLYPIPGLVVNVGNFSFQVVRSKKLGNRLVKIPRSMVWTFPLPKVFGSSIGSILERRARGLTSQLIPSFLDGQNYLEDKIFDVSYFLKERKLLAAKSTRNWAWNGRSQWLEEAPEFYYFYREISFGKMLAILRNHILLRMNLLLKHVEIEAKITSTMPGPSDFDALQASFVAGKINYSEVSKKLREFNFEVPS